MQAGLNVEPSPRSRSLAHFFLLARSLTCFCSLAHFFLLVRSPLPARSRTSFPTQRGRFALGPLFNRSQVQIPAQLQPIQSKSNLLPSSSPHRRMLRPPRLGPGLLVRDPLVRNPALEPAARRLALRQRLHRFVDFGGSLDLRRELAERTERSVEARADKVCVVRC